MPRTMICAAAAAFVLLAGGAVAQTGQGDATPRGSGAEGGMPMMQGGQGDGMPMMRGGHGRRMMQGDQRDGMPMMQGGQGDGMSMMRGGHGRRMRRGHSMMGGHGGPGGMGPHMMLMMMAMIDTDLSGTLSLEEVQAVHARLFRYADADGDGELTMEELRAFMHGQGKPPGR